MTFKDFFKNIFNKNNTKEAKITNKPNVRNLVAIGDINDSTLSNFGNTEINIKSDNLNILLPEFTVDGFLKDKQALADFKLKLRKRIKELNPNVDELGFDIIDITQTSAKLIGTKYSGTVEVTYSLKD